ncbi:MAG: DUF1624 domain-containing protein [Verrucomicrobia bacterium]|nr:DUF1624 domain-containing protein [Verrucomicrobiota bacterium]
MPSDSEALSAAAEITVPPGREDPRPRLDSVDLVRGIVMILMALDHTRSFFSNVNFYPLDLERTWPALYWTRWITHYCAPVFVFLAGTGAFLSTTRGKTTKELSWFLVTRGLWLVLLECTIIKWFGWTFSIDFHSIGAGVIWAIGWSMLALAGLVFLPVPWIGLFGVAMIAGHNLFDRVSAEQFGSIGWLWTILHTGGQVRVGSDFTIAVGYPLIPWIGVMAAGYAFGKILLWEPERRRKVIFAMGAAMIALFVVLRGFNIYGNPGHWASQKSPLFSLFSLLNCQKYPPSLAYLLMTLGPALMVLSLFDRIGVPGMLKPALVFGRVPLFYYLLHLPFIHGLALALRRNSCDLPMVYLFWILVIAILYPLCAWFADLKRRRREVWLSYF